MSERWGICKACGGEGEVFINDELKECGMCMGTPGFSGDAFEMHLRPKRSKPRITPTKEYVMEKAVEAVRKKIE